MTYLKNKKDANHSQVLNYLRVHGCEIKVSKSDLKKDVEKRKWAMAERYGYSKKIKDLYFAVPEKLADAAKEYAPEQAGILTVAEFTEAFQYWSGMVNCVRKPVANKDAQVLTASDQSNLLRLAHMRIWGMKEKLIKAMEAVAKNDISAAVYLCDEDKDEFEMSEPETKQPEQRVISTPLFT
jgi:hypothetical protein